MPTCDGGVRSQCSQPNADSSASEEGKWVGITIGLWLVVILLVWLTRTCIKPDRRRQLAFKLTWCFRRVGCVKSTTETRAECNSVTVHDASVSRGNRRSNDTRSNLNGSIPGVIDPNEIQHPPPSYQDAISSTSSSGSHWLVFPRTRRHHRKGKTDGDCYGDDNSGTDSDDTDDDSDDDCFDDTDTDSATSNNSSSSSGNGRLRGGGAFGGRFRSRPSRNSLSSVSIITLATIEEDTNEMRHSSHSQPELHMPEVRITITGTYSRSQSVPAKLFTMDDSSPAPDAVDCSSFAAVPEQAELDGEDQSRPIDSQI